MAGQAVVDAAGRETRLRQALWAIAASICVVAPVELALSEHWEPGPQLIPFALSAVGLVAITAATLRPGPTTLKASRWGMAVLLAGAAFGVWEHLEHNFEFAAEIAPNAQFGELAIEALMGANPLLAPGIFGVAALCGLAAAWAHPLARR